MLWLPGIVFLAICVWLVRKLVMAARNEGDLEAERLSGTLAEELQAGRERAAQRPLLAPVKEQRPLDGADLSLADPSHLPLVEQMAAEREQQLRAQHQAASGRRVEVLWVRSNATHAVWCERRHAASTAARALTRDVICVAQIEKGSVTERWFFG